MEKLNDTVRGIMRAFAESAGRPDLLVGFADLEDIPGSETASPLPKAVSFAAALNPEVISKQRSAPTLEYYGEYMECSRFVDDLAAHVAHKLREMGHRAKVLAESDAGSPHDSFSHRTIATHAGLGWMGRNGMVVTKHFGPAVLLGTVLTDAPVECSTEVFLSRCGRCLECAKACPAGAIINVDHAPSSGSEPLVNHAACVKTSHERAFRAFGIKADVCGACIYSCPYTKSFLRRRNLEYN